MTIRNTLTAIVLGGALALGSGCDNRSERIKKMEDTQGTYQITHSVERDNVNKRLALANDPTQIMWVYCLSDMGNVIISSPVVGKVSSSTKRLEPSSGERYGTGIDTHSIGGERYTSNELMGADGTFGSSDPYVYWFTPEGQYLQWNGEYVVSNVPLKLERAVFNIRDIDYNELNKGKKAEEALKSGKKINNNLEVEVEVEKR